MTRTLPLLRLPALLAAALSLSSALNAAPLITARTQVLAEPAVVSGLMDKAVHWQLENQGPKPKLDWIVGTFYSGVMGAYRTTNNPAYLEASRKWCDAAAWKTSGSRLFADDVCMGQTMLDVYEKEPAPEKLAHLRESLDLLFTRQTLRANEVGNPFWKTVDAERPLTGRNLWWWCDALYMQPPVMARFAQLTGEAKYREKLHELYWDAVDFLYDKEEHLFFRDAGQFPERTKSPTGKKVFWSRGNGWVFAGLVRVIDALPENDPVRPKYIALFREMAETLIRYQQDDGLWRSSLNEPTWHTMPESSGTSFFCFGLTAGVNRGWLDRDTYLPHALKAWEGVCGVLDRNGRLGFSQPVDHRPNPSKFTDSRPYTQGAFLLAGSELLKLAR